MSRTLTIEGVADALSQPPFAPSVAVPIESSLQQRVLQNPVGRGAAQHRIPHRVSWRAVIDG